jgi:hypothetical protein
MSFVLGLITILILASNYPDCTTSNLKFAMFMMFMIYMITFCLLLANFIGLAGYLKVIPRALFLFYISVVTIMFFVQMILFQSDKCYIEVPLIYFWLLVQIIFFYFIVAYGLAKWGAYLCWYAEHKEEIMKKKMKEYVK